MLSFGKSLLDFRSRLHHFQMDIEICKLAGLPHFLKSLGCASLIRSRHIPKPQVEIRKAISDYEALWISLKLLVKKRNSRLHAFRFILLNVRQRLLALCRVTCMLVDGMSRIVAFSHSVHQVFKSVFHVNSIEFTLGSQNSICTLGSQVFTDDGGLAQDDRLCAIVPEQGHCKEQRVLLLQLLPSFIRSLPTHSTEWFLSRSFCFCKNESS